MWLATPSTRKTPAKEPGYPPEPPEQIKTPVSGLTSQGPDTGQVVMIPGGSSASAVQATCPDASSASVEPRSGSGSKKEPNPKGRRQESRLCLEDEETSLHIVAQCPALARIRMQVFGRVLLKEPLAWSVNELTSFLQEASIGNLLDQAHEEQTDV